MKLFKIHTLIVQIMKTIMLWSTPSTHRYAPFAAYLEILACPSKKGMQLMEHNGLYLTHSIICYRFSSIDSIPMWSTTHNKLSCHGCWNDKARLKKKNNCQMMGQMFGIHQRRKVGSSIHQGDCGNSWKKHIWFRLLTQKTMANLSI